jgi:hypothetical protein
MPALKFASGGYGLPTTGDNNIKGRTYVSALRLGAHTGAPLQTVSFLTCMRATWYYERHIGPPLQYLSIDEP